MPPRRLVELPDDVLDKCMGELLPPIELYPVSGEQIVPIPTDLYNVMLVSQRLHSISLPWVWRRIHIHLSPSIKVDGEYVDRWTYYENYLFCHPERFAHVRLFALLYVCTDEIIDVPVLPSLRSCIAFMENLQVFSCTNFGQHKNQPMIQDIFIELASKSHVHTITTPLFPLTAISSLTTNLRRLTVRTLEVDAETLRTLETLGTLGVVPFLESLTIAYSPSCFLPFSVPWNTLRGLQFYECSGLDWVMYDFSEWKLASPTNHSPLEELTAEFFYARVHSEVVPACLDSILDTFKLQLPELKTFTLVDYPGIDGALITRIAEAFPGLQTLTLVSQPWSYYEWEALSPIVTALKTFPLLKHLRWSYRNIEFDTDTPATEDTAKRLRFEEIIPHVAQHCDALEVVEFYDWRYHSGTFSIKRDEAGRYVGYEEVENEEHELKTYFCFSSTLSPTTYRRI